MKSAVRFLPWFLVIFSAGAAPCAVAAVMESGPAQTQLVELFSSEGCSSCPPADAWIGQLKDKDGLWERFVPAVFHVTYWDDLGWPDRFAKKEFTVRQQRYAQSWGGYSVYTPGMVLNGREWKDWYRYPTVPEESAGPAGTLRVTFEDDGRLHILFTPSGDEDGSWKANAALLGFGVVSDIGAGENRGKTLRHDFLVVDFQSGTMTHEDSGYTSDIRVNVQAQEGEWERLGLAVWVTRGDNLSPVQTTGGYL